MTSWWVKPTKCPDCGVEIALDDEVVVRGRLVHETVMGKRITVRDPMVEVIHAYHWLGPDRDHELVRRESLRDALEGLGPLVPST